jgi:hypothetical protein
MPGGTGLVSMPLRFAPACDRVPTARVGGVPALFVARFRQGRVIPHGHAQSPSADCGAWMQADRLAAEDSGQAVFVQIQTRIPPDPS